MSEKYKYKVRHKIVDRKTPVGYEYRTECGHAVSRPIDMALKTKDKDPCPKCFSKRERDEMVERK